MPVSWLSSRKARFPAKISEKFHARIHPYTRDKGKPTGLLIEARAFLGWDSFGALLEHFKFVYHHHRNIDRVAAVTDSAFSKIAPTIAQHFAHPDIRVFASGERVKALEWLQTGA